MYDLILTPTVAANLFEEIITMANPIAVLMGMSALGDKMGEKLAPEFIHVNDDGLKTDGLGTTPFDVEGTSRQSTPIIKEGVLVNFIHNTSISKLSDTSTTGNSELADIGLNTKFLAPAPTNIVFNNGDRSFEELFENGTKPTIFVTSNWYTRYISPISTDYSTIPRDAAFLIENGEMNTPLKNFRISDNLLRQLANIDAMVNDRVQVKWWEVYIPTWVPTVRVKDCRITTATQ
ncbi:MAG: metallopeptidase TldD-related protein [Candidatus Hodarchaeota archaeon]